MELTPRSSSRCRSDDAAMLTPAPGCFLASSAILCCVVYVFVELSVSSNVSHQWVCTSDAPLPSSGSRWPRFPAFTGTIKALRLPAPHGLRLIDSPSGSAGACVLRVRPTRSPRLAGPTAGRGLACSRWPSPLQRSWPRARAGSPRFPDDPFRDSAPVHDPDDPSRLAASGASGAAPGWLTSKASSFYGFRGCRDASSPTVYASRCALPHAMQDSFPAGGLRLCRAGIEPAESQQEVSVHFILLSRAYPGAIIVPFLGDR